MSSAFVFLFFCFLLKVWCHSRLQTSLVWTRPEACVAQCQTAPGCLQRLQQGEPHHNSRCHALSHRAVHQQSTGKQVKLQSRCLVDSRWLSFVFTHKFVERWLLVMISWSFSLCTVFPQTNITRGGAAIHPVSKNLPGPRERWVLISYCRVSIHILHILLSAKFLSDLNLYIYIDNWYFVYYFFKIKSSW